MGGWRDEAEARRLEETEDIRSLKRRYKSQIRPSYDSEPNSSIQSLLVVSAAVGGFLWVVREGRKLNSKSPLESIKGLMRRIVGTRDSGGWKDVKPSQMAAAAAAARQQSGSTAAGKKKKKKKKKKRSH